MHMIVHAYSVFHQILNLGSEKVCHAFKGGTYLRVVSISIPCITDITLAEPNV